MPNIMKPGEKTYPLVLPIALLRQVKAIAAARGETMKVWLERAAREQITRDLAGGDGSAEPAPPRRRRDR